MTSSTDFNRATEVCNWLGVDHVTIDDYSSTSFKTSGLARVLLGKLCKISNET